MGLVSGKFLDSIFIQETPSGTINGSNTSFSLSQTPHSDGAVLLLQDGIFLKQGASDDYTISGSTITMGTAPANGQDLQAFYIKK